MIKVHDLPGTILLLQVHKVLYMVLKAVLKQVIQLTYLDLSLKLILRSHYSDLELFLLAQEIR
jgi:hypothetical protein